MELHVELAYGTPSGRGIVLPHSKIGTYTKLARETGNELYRSLFMFEEDILEHFKVKKTIRSYHGNAHMEKLLLDIDAGANDDETMRRVEQTLARLHALGITPTIWFSGTGFHLTCNDPFHIDPSRDLPLVLRNTLEAAEIPNIDLKIYEITRLIRVANTVNKKSGLYKVQLPDLPASMALIRAIAKDQQPIIPQTVETPDLRHMVRVPPPPTLSITSSARTDDPSRFVTCMQKLYARGPVKGRRHTDLIALVSSWRRAGLPSQAAVALATQWVGMGPDPMSGYEITRAVNDIYDKAYKYSCDHPIMQEFCDAKCYFYKTKGYGSSVVDATDAEKTLVEWARTDFAGRTIDLKTAMGISTNHVIYPSELVLIFGDTGMGKSAFVQNMLINSNLRSIYITLEMPSFFLFRRFVQIQNRMSKAEVLKYYQTQTNTLSEKLGHITMMHVPPTLEEIKRVIADQKPQIVVIDPVDALNVKGAILDRENLIANTLKEIANSQDIIMLCVHHVAKHAVYDTFGKRKRLTNLAGKGSSTLPHRADKVIGIEPPERHVETLFGQPREVTSLKARDEPFFNQMFSFIPDTFRFVPLEREGEEITHGTTIQKDPPITGRDNSFRGEI